MGIELALASVAASVAGAIASTAGSLIVGNQEEQMANYNAQLAEQEAANARAEASAQISQDRLAQKQQLAAQRAAAAANGLEMTGSPLQVMAESAKRFELQNQNTSYAGQARAQSLLQSAEMYRNTAANARTNKWFSVGGSILSGTSMVANAYTAGQKNYAGQSIFAKR